MVNRVCPLHSRSQIDQFFLDIKARRSRDAIVGNLKRGTGGIARQDIFGEKQMQPWPPGIIDDNRRRSIPLRVNWDNRRIARRLHRLLYIMRQEYTRRW